MCEICVKAQDETRQTGQGATADAWARVANAMRAWLESLPDDSPVHDLGELDRAVAWAEHISGKK